MQHGASPRPWPHPPRAAEPPARLAPRVPSAQRVQAAARGVQSAGIADRRDIHRAVEIPAARAQARRVEGDAVAISVACGPEPFTVVVVAFFARKFQRKHRAFRTRGIGQRNTELVVVQDSIAIRVHIGGHIGHCIDLRRHEPQRPIQKIDEG